MRTLPQWALIALAVGCSTPPEAPRRAAAPPRTWTAAESDPVTLGWMQGFPPPPLLRIGQPDSDFFSFPKLRWSVCHLRELLPTERVHRGLGAPVPLPGSLDGSLDGSPDGGLAAEIDALTFEPLGGGAPLTWADSLAANFTDGVLVLHRGRVVYERYFGALRPDGEHAAMSMTKSLTGLLAEVLVAEGTLDENARVDALVPELRGSGFGDATVRQVMDMTTGIRFSEDYADPNADIWAYAAAASPFPRPSDAQGPNGYCEYLPSVRSEGPHGVAFGYKTVNSDVLGWILARASGLAVTELLSERIWRHIGAEQDASFTVDGRGTPFAGGGMSAGLRDLGRIGQLMLEGGTLYGQRIIPAAAVASIRRGGDRDAFARAGYTWLPGASYRGMWWVLHNAHGAFAARGVHGQTIYVDPLAEMVIVRFASFPLASNSAIDPTSLPAFQAVAEHLLRRR